MTEVAAGPVRILSFAFDDAMLKRLDNRRRNQLFGCMHAHNELTFLNRLLMFAGNATADGSLHDHAQIVQWWSALQLLAGKHFETWAMLNERILKATPPDRLVVGLSAEHAVSLQWLRDYFGEQQPKNNPIKTIRDKTAFHYDGLDLGQAVKSLDDTEKVVHIAKHPVNAMYFLGSAVTFRAIFVQIADEQKPAAGRSCNEPG